MILVLALLLPTTPAVGSTVAPTEQAGMWVNRPPLPEPLNGLSAVTMGGRILAIAGVAGGTSPTIEPHFSARVDARPGTVDGLWRDLEPLQIPRANHVSADVGGLVYVAGGFSLGADPALDDVQTSVERFNPLTGHWSTGVPLPEPRAAAGAAGLNGLFYVAGGFTPFADDFKASKSVIVFDPRTGVWREVGSMTGPRARLRLVASGGYLYTIGGVGRFDESLRTVERYDPRSNRWTPVASMNESRTVPCAVETVVGHRRVLVVVGGSQYGRGFSFITARKTSEVFDPDTGKWQTLGALLPLARASHDCGTEVNGTVVAIAGSVLQKSGEIVRTNTVLALTIRPQDIG